MSKRAALFAAAFMLLSVIHAAVGFWVPKLPAWRMFATTARYRYEIRDAHGTQVRLHDYLPARAYALVSARHPLRLALWIATRQPERAPLVATVTTLGRTRETTREYLVVAEPPGARLVPQP